MGSQVMSIFCLEFTFIAMKLRSNSTFLNGTQQQREFFYISIVTRNIVILRLQNLPSSRAFSNYILSCKIYHTFYICRNLFWLSHQEMDMNMKGMIDVLLIPVVDVVGAAAVVAALIEASLSVLIALKDKQKNKLICGNRTYNFFFISLKLITERIIIKFSWKKHLKW